VNSTDSGSQPLAVLPHSVPPLNLGMTRPGACIVQPQAPMIPPLSHNSLASESDHAPLCLCVAVLYAFHCTATLS
jgi:hypothetical protein